MLEIGDVRYLYTFFGQTAKPHLTEICIQTSDKAARSFGGREGQKAQESERSWTGALHAAVINQLRKSSLTPSQSLNLRNRVIGRVFHAPASSNSGVAALSG